MNRLFRDILRENKNDYIRTVLGCSWIISLIYFSTAVGGCLSYISTGSIPQMTYLIMEVEKEFRQFGLWVNFAIKDMLNKQ